MPVQAFAEDLKQQPYWWEEAPPPAPARDPAVLPDAVDAAIVGGGFTGLSAALTLARAGRSVLVLEAEHAGFGASSRNGGMVSPRLKASFPELRARLGPERAVTLYREARAAYDFTAGLIAAEGIDCHFAATGRFIGAHTPGRYEAMARQATELRRHLGAEIHMVPRAEQHTEVGGDHFHGGEVVVDFGGLHPALYTRGLLARARAAGATVAGGTPVTGLAHDGDGFTVATATGAVRARDVIVATNGYSGPAAPWLRRRVIPIGSQLIATEPLAPQVMARVMPKGRMMGDTRKLHHYFRPSPDGQRMVFGGRVTRAGLMATARQLYDRMVGMFPQLDGVRVTHTWAGKVAFTFDTLPHIGVHGGVHYAMGYCGAGVAMATYLGHKAARRVLEAADAATAFDGLAFPTRPLYTGYPWFLPAAMSALALRDRMGP